MAVKRSINRVLARAAGYKLVSAERPQAPARPLAAPPRPARNGMPRDYDAEAQRIIRKVKPRTMTGRGKLFALILAARHIADHGVPGSVVECGVWRGGSMQAVAYTLLERDAAVRNLHLFDTFEGMPPPTEEDRRLDGTPAAELLETRDRDSNVWAVATLEDVHAGIAETGYPSELVHFHPGRVEERIPGEAPDEIAILRLDTDWYESTRHELEHLYDRVPRGGVLIIDDYGFWQGARQAVDEFLERTGAPLLLLPMGSGRIALKP